MATRPLQARGGLGIAQRFYDLVTKFPTAAYIASCILVIDILVPPHRFADYYQYLLITDGLWYFDTANWLGFEAGSNLLFVSLRLLMGNTERAIDVAHYLLGGMFAVFAFRFAARKEVSWQGLLTMFSLYGSLLAFVTIRATPAYLLVAVGALEASKGRWSAILLGLAATMFHVSAVLALAPLLVALAQNRLSSLAWVGRSTRSLAVALGLTVILFVAFRATLIAALASAVAAVPFLGKYVVYTAALDPLNNNGPSAGPSILHLIYFIVLSVFTAVMLLMPEDRCRRFRGYLIGSYGVYLFLQFSPVTAYRESQFWMVPAVLIFPWARFVKPGLLSILFIIFSVSFFATTMPGVIG